MAWTKMMEWGRTRTYAPRSGRCAAPSASPASGAAAPACRVKDQTPSADPNPKSSRLNHAQPKTHRSVPWKPLATAAAAAAKSEAGVGICCRSPPSSSDGMAAA